MQTFLPFPSFIKSLKCLDRQRLGKQRVESKQILDVLTGESKGWINHPCVKMWDGYSEALKVYYNYNLIIWERRGYKNNILKPMEVDMSKAVYPYWFKNEKFHISHQSNLLRKDYKHYSRFFDVPTDLPYIWPKSRRLKFGH